MKKKLKSWLKLDSLINSLGKHGYIADILQKIVRFEFEKNINIGKKSVSYQQRLFGPRQSDDIAYYVLFFYVP